MQIIRLFTAIESLKTDADLVRIAELLALFIPAIGLSFIQQTDAMGPVIIVVFSLATGSVFGVAYRLSSFSIPHATRVVSVTWLLAVMAATVLIFVEHFGSLGGFSSYRLSILAIGWFSVLAVAIQPRHRRHLGDPK